MIFIIRNTLRFSVGHFFYYKGKFFTIIFAYNFLNQSNYKNTNNNDIVSHLNIEKSKLDRIDQFLFRHFIKNIFFANILSFDPIWLFQFDYFEIK